MPQIVHFEIPTDDMDRSKKFYSELFGWTIQDIPGMDNNVHEGMKYLIITIKDENGNPAQTGGMVTRHIPQQQGMTNYFDVKSIEEYSSKEQQLGGKVIIQKKPVSQMGYFALCQDTENNIFGIWETDTNAK